MVQASTYGKAIVFTCTVGIALCVYAFVVEERKSQDAKYQAVCDLSEHMSCSRVLTSPYAKGFGLVRHVLGEDSPLNVPNSIPGGVMFTLFALLCFLQRAWTARIQLVLGILSNISSVYLGSILYFVLQDFCVICVSVYAINFINLVLAFLRLRALTSKPVGKQKGQQKSQKGQKGGKQQQNDKQKSPQAEKKKEKQKSPQAEKQKQNQQNGKVKNQQNDKQKSPKTPNSKKKN
ncbi:Vitamin K epoxide reductase complex subunit 1-like protein 1 [Gryllus bimaculatus]|nr:Vitamin K epoxide reductase complex subunit 1-like protein 1 [Gryllus bimaculatus]